MKFLSDRMTSASGSIGGSTFSHNRFGMYVRARRVPVNPNTTFQQSQRDAFSQASALWRTLTGAQRAGWEAYAAATPVTNSLGQQTYLSGFQQFTATNALGQRLGFSPLLAAPASPGRAPIGMPTVVMDASASSVVFTNLDASIENGTLGLFLGDPQSPGVSFFAGPYQLRATATITAGTTGTMSPAGSRNGVAFVAGQRIPWRLAGVDADQRLSQEASGIATVVA